MTSIQTDRTGSVNSSSAIKVPCRVATTADLTPSLSQGALNAGGGGLFTIDGIALNAGDRVLVKNQTDQTTNGIWLAATTAWLRDVDAQDNRALVKGSLVLVTDGTLSGGLFFELTTANPINIGSSNITFAVTSTPTISGAMSPVIGAATLAAARTAMAVPGLGDNNTFTGTETFNGAATFGSTATFNGAVTFNASDTDAATLVMSGAAINEARSTIASASTTNIGAALGNYLQVTGTTTINAFDTVQAGTRRLLEFAAALTLTNSGNVILPGAANITTAAGDLAGFVSEGAGVWRCTGYMRVSGAPVNMSPITNSLSGDVTLNNAANYFDGPSVAQGTAGIWFVSGTVTVTDTAAATSYDVKLWDGTTVIASGEIRLATANAGMIIALSGMLTSPAGNLRISVKANNTTSLIKFNLSANAKDSTITAIRVG